MVNRAGRGTCVVSGAGRGAWVVSGAGRGTGVVGRAGRGAGVVGRARFSAPGDRVDHVQGDRLRIGLLSASPVAPECRESPASSSQENEDYRSRGSAVDEVKVEDVRHGGPG